MAHAAMPVASISRMRSISLWRRFGFELRLFAHRCPKYAHLFRQNSRSGYNPRQSSVKMTSSSSTVKTVRFASDTASNASHAVRFQAAKLCR
jgi:hypothetical protein